ncbi:hypothetical protein [Agromyces sp. NPDC049794]|uniref:hypothetical protein n=1 Tax=unclassified Agromyces TaxID=2639701 RepID=UPI0033D15621
MEHRIEPLAVVAASVLALLLSGCAGAAVETAGQGAAGGTVAPVEAASPTETPAAPDPDSTPAATTCDTVLTADEYARLADDGLAVDDAPYLLGPVMERMATAGALVCVWSKPMSDVSAWYARLDVGGDGARWLTELEAEGWLEDTERGDGTYLAPADYDANYQPSVQLRDGVLHFASYNRFLESVLELQ